MRNNNEIKHYGVLGMKWGVRKKRTMSADAQRTASIRKKKIYEMSNEELKTAKNRLELESQYKQFADKKKVGKRAVQAFIKTAGTITAVTAAYGTYKKLGKEGKKALDKTFNKVGDWVLKDMAKHL